ncbi:hypothetical protein ACHAWF_002419 [Thalassiosira exigua]
MRAMSTTPTTTVVFACKSNSCRSQMAEAWAREWIATEQRKLAGRRDRRLGAFLDGLVVASAALDESSVAADGTDSPALAEAALGSSPTSSLVADFEAAACVTCDGEACSSSPTRRRKPPKEKAVRAMAEDGVDISGCYAKSFRDLLSIVLDRRRSGVGEPREHERRSWSQILSFQEMRRMLGAATREMGMSFAGVPREENEGEEGDDRLIVDTLVVLCSCPESMKRQLSGVSRETLDWDIDPPSTAAKSEGDGAYLRVSRQIRSKVNAFLDELKSCAVMMDDDEGADARNVNLIHSIVAK